jgi:lysyl-tRNA synthetase class I
VGVLQKVLTPFSRENVSVKFKRVVVCCPNCGKAMGLTGVTRLDGDGGLVYEVWRGEGDDDCW